MSKDFVLTSAVIAGAHSPSTTATSTTATITSSLRTGIASARRRIGKADDVLAPAASRVSYESTKAGVPYNYGKE